jgi:putative FmdB family regulatory protein
MPIYEYICKNCGHHLEELQSMSEPPLIKCPICGHNTLQKLIGTGAGIIFKGSGFYETDYKKSEASKKDTHKKHAIPKSEKTTDKKTSVKKESSKETKTDKTTKHDN